MNHISPANHPESYLSGSTIESMIDRAVELGNEYFAVTDNGMMSSILKGYMYAQKKGIKLIAGVEIYFKDNTCDIIRNTPSEKIKYFKLIIHAKDQSAYQKLVKMSSDLSRKTVSVAGNNFPLFNWADLEELSQYNVTACTSNIEGMVSKHLLVGRPDLSMKYYEKLRNTIGADDFYPTIVPFKHDKYWHEMVKVGLSGDKTVDILSDDRINTDSKYNKNKAKDLMRKYGDHSLLTHVYINGVEYKVKPEFQEIKSKRIFNGFLDLPEDIQLKANKLTIALAKRYGDIHKLLINNYAYYATKEDKIVQDMKLGEDKRVYQNNFMASTGDVEEYVGQLSSMIKGDSTAIFDLVSSSKEWASKFTGFELKYDYRLPDFGDNLNEQLIQIIRDVGRMKWDDERYLTQFKEEFDLLTKNGVINLIPYFLPIVDIYKFYKENGYLTGPARGSAGGFLISYLLGITHIDPIKYGLYSSRFLTVDRVRQGNLPDIDCDLESRVPLVGKDGSSGYLFNKYGNKAAQISTRTLLRIKSAILDANRFVNGGTVEPEIQALSKSLPNTPQGVEDSEYVFGYEDENGSWVDGLLDKDSALNTYSKERPEEWDIVKRSLSLSRQNGRHACAFIISDTDIEDVLPIMEVGGVKRVTQPEAKQCEWAGLIKYDFLVVSALKDIGLCLKLINKKNEEENKTGYFNHNGKEAYIWDLPEDPAVFKDLGDGKTETVFQLHTTSVTPFVKKIKPNSIIDCATVTSLVRPGPLDFKDEETGRNMVEEFVERKRGRSSGKIKILNEMLPETYGVIVYQEQVSKIARELGGMSIEDSENVRIAMGKKKIKLLASLKPKFIEGASKKVGEVVALTIWSMMETFARYGFNKSHAVAYSVISYACAFLKHHYPLEWWAGVLSNASDKEINEEFYKYVKDMVLPPDINTSTETMSVDYINGKIRNKLSIISGLGTKVANNIIDKRPYMDIKDFVRKKPCGPSMTKKLIHVGVLDSIFEGTTLKDKMYEYENALLDIKREEKIEKYNIDINKAASDKEKQRIIKNRDKFINKPRKEAEIDIEYVAMSAKTDFLIKKSIFPTINLDLNKVLEKHSTISTIESKKDGRNYIENKQHRLIPILNGESLQNIDDRNVSSTVTFCVPGYVVESSEFTYSKGSKKALKLVIDSSGYLSEKVIWPDYDTGELVYDKCLKKGAIVYFLYNKKPNKPYTNIIETFIEAESIV